MFTKPATEINKEYGVLSEQFWILPIKITPFYYKKISEEISNLGLSWPLYKIWFPTKDKISLFAPWEVNDWVDDRDNMLWGSNCSDLNIVQKYKNRILVLSTENCFWHCQYCFRQDILSEKQNKKWILLEKIIPQIMKYLSQDKNIEEIILSWWDPMIIPYSQLKYFFETIYTNTHIRNFRIHTRAIIYNPNVFTYKMIKLLKKYNVRLVFHISHPYEICDVVEKYIKTISKNMIRCYNQFPILRWVNDHVNVLKALLSKMDELNIHNLSIFIPDPIRFSASFRIPFKRILNIIDQLNLTTSSWINSTRLVLDTVYGKVRRDNVESYDLKKNIVVFSRWGKKIYYPDFPEHLDKPWKLKTMLRKQYLSLYKK